MIIDCDSCAIRGIGCSDCVISVLLDAPPKVELDEPELRAIDRLADAGLVPRLRLVPLHAPSVTPDAVNEPTSSAERSGDDDGRQRRQVS